MKRLFAFTVAAAAAFAAPAAAKDLIKMSTLGPGSSPNLVMTTFATIVNQSDDDIEIQVNATGAATKHALEAAQGKVDLYMYSPLVHTFMTERKAMFAKIEKAPELAKNLRALFAFPIGQYHFTVYEDSGIRSFEDIEGKKVFLGPPAGAARVVSAGVIAALTGYKAGEDFTAVKLGWGAASQAFQDGQIEVYANSTNAPSPVIQQVALTKKIRFLGIPRNRLDEPAVKKLTNRPGGSLGTIPAGVYGDNQMNEEDVITIRAVVGIGAGKHLGDDLVYRMVKAFWENVGSEVEGTPWLRAVRLDNAFEQMNVVLHPGAVRYYDEIGLAIPDRLRP